MHELSYTLSRGETRVTVGKSVKEYIQGLPENTLAVYPESIASMVEPVLAQYSIHAYPLKDGEEGKSLQSVIQIIEEMRKAEFRRSSTIVSIGGGTTSDAAGMAASMYMRGVRYVSIPTTFLAMVDAALGGKNAVNLNGIKNLIGSFYSPSEVLIDVSLIPGMPSRLIIDGMGEVAKYALILDPELFLQLNSHPIGDMLKENMGLENLVLRCVKDKMDIVASDEFDQLGKRILLNFGHTLGHAIESATNFTTGHGTAVAIGMLLELDMGIKLGLVGEDLFGSARELLGKIGLPNTIDGGFFAGMKGRMKEAISSDKKALRNTVKIPLPIKPGYSDVFEVKLSDVGDYIERL